MLFRSHMSRYITGSFRPTSSTSTTTNIPGTPDTGGSRCVRRKTPDPTTSLHKNNKSKLTGGHTPDKHKGIKRKTAEQISTRPDSDTPWTNAEGDHPRRRQRIASLPVCRECNVVTSHARYDFTAYTCIYRTQHGLRPDFEYNLSHPHTATTIIHNTSDNTHTNILSYDKHIVDS